MADNVELNHQSRMKDWETKYGFAMHSDGLAAQIDVFLLKALMSVNGAALVAVLAAYPHMREIPSFQAAVYLIGLLYVGGLISGLFAGIFAYFYQSAITANEWTNMHKEFGDQTQPAPYQWAERTSTLLRILMIGFCIVSLGLFIAGCLKLLSVFAIG